MNLDHADKRLENDLVIFNEVGSTFNFREIVKMDDILIYLGYLKDILLLVFPISIDLRAAV